MLVTFGLAVDAGSCIVVAQHVYCKGVHARIDTQTHQLPQRYTITLSKNRCCAAVTWFAVSRLGYAATRSPQFMSAPDSRR